MAEEDKNTTEDMNKIFLVYYCGGYYDDSYETVIFATAERKTANNYVNKFNRILKKWKKYYSQFETDIKGFVWIDDKYIEQHYDRWYSLQNIRMCYYEEIPIR